MQQARRWRALVSAAGLMALAGTIAVVTAQPSLPPGLARAQPTTPGPAGGRPAQDFPAYTDVIKDLEKVTPTGGESSLYTLFKRDKDTRLLAELPRDFERQKVFIATTVAGGVPSAGIQGGDTYAYWKRYDKRLALIEPETGVRTTGDAESKRTESIVYTDRVLLDVPILTVSPTGGPVIDLTDLLVNQSDRFFPGVTTGANRRLATIAKAKAFPENVELAFEMPDRTGRLVTIYYSVSLLKPNPAYKPREADPRVGYFTTFYRDISRLKEETPWVRYVNRWHLEKRDPKLELSPPKEPIVFYVDSTTPIQYRRWVREGILEWNKAFEKVGFYDAVEVRQQDTVTGAYMDVDPEDVRYNFVRWTSANLGFAIGPSRVNPETGQILDADVVLDDGFIRGWLRSYQQLLPEVAMEGLPAETVAWFESNPKWDPRLRLADPAERDVLLQSRAIRHAQQLTGLIRGADERGQPGSEVPVMALRSGQPLLFAGQDSDGELGMRYQQCAAILGKSLDVSVMRTALDAGILDLLQPAESGAQPKDETKDDKKDDKKQPPKKKEVLLDGLPEWFVGPLLKDLVMHEVGHTLGLRHNFKASSIHTLAEMNTPEFKGNKTITGSVMDYTPLNINFQDGPSQGDFNQISIGSYDYWAIEYGYGDNPKETLKGVSNPLHAYGTDEDSAGVDPLIRRFDLGKDSLDYSESTMRLVRFLRGKLLDKVVKDGDPWSKVRDGYQLLLGRHTTALSTAAFWLGGAHTVRDRKGDPGDRVPVVPVSVEQQRRALKLIVENGFRDEAFGLTRELLERMTVEKWSDPGGFGALGQSEAWPIHDRILAVQGTAISLVMNPTTLQRVYDNELRIAPGSDALTLPELLNAVTGEVFSELGSLKRGTAREPSISSLRRNLQRELLDRLIDLTLPDAGFTAAYKPISNLVVVRLRDIKGSIDNALKTDGIDPYTKAHLTEASLRLDKALNADYIYNAGSIGGGLGGLFPFFQTNQPAPEPRGTRYVPPALQAEFQELSTPEQGTENP